MAHQGPATVNHGINQTWLCVLTEHDKCVGYLFSSQTVARQLGGKKTSV